MESCSIKEYLCLEIPTDDDAISDHKRIEYALHDLGYEHVTVPHRVLRQLYPLCRDAGFCITVTLVQREYDWILTAVEAGDRRQHHYGLAVDYGSTTIVMQLVDLNSGMVIGEAKTVNGQAAYGTDILSRIIYTLEGSAQMAELQRVTVDTFR